VRQTLISRHRSWPANKSQNAICGDWAPRSVVVIAGLNVIFLRFRLDRTPNKIYRSLRSSELINHIDGLFIAEAECGGP
jgi:hypothetical protein